MKRYIVLAGLLLALGAFPAFSQEPLVGSIHGTVTDPHREPVSGATVTATNLDSVEPDTHVRYAVTDGGGIYEFVDISPGHYSILVQRQGYRAGVLDDVTVHPGQKVTVKTLLLTPGRTAVK